MDPRMIAARIVRDLDFLGLLQELAEEDEAADAAAYLHALDYLRGVQDVIVALLTSEEGRHVLRLDEPEMQQAKIAALREALAKLW